ncbi:M14 family metallopeptidase [Chondromyces apiculatus]|uniref:Putative carboxypeptidase, Zn dependent n=1 Tax=Chondromyces apiculatus DSM 436 TaxID=1192034 RepID=A0A017T8D0_9BACT|nr:M14-type cytosolic carboxypeptidase [Chondromyces apiculatus]EYF04866.1 putative carboxypeptidase, Zn dependent [Chondromyces apiculatus DSM 436]
MQIDCDFDGGSIEILNASDPSSVALALRGDNAAEYMQWFYFRVRHAAGVACTFRIVNARQASYPGGWWEYGVCASYDGEHWFRVPTEHDGQVLAIHHRPERDVVAYACFAPYPTDRYEGLLDQVRASGQQGRPLGVFEVGKSLEGRPMNVIVCGDQGRSVPRVWIIAHQHPGETMAGWFMEGVVRRMLDEGDGVARGLLDRAVVYLVPRMNPDGCARGNHRTNAAGRDLNREWLYPDRSAAPEVFHVREAMQAGGVDLFLDVHGDESIPYVFAYGAEGVPSYTQRLASLEERFAATLERIDGEYQRARGYELDPPGKADLRLSSLYVAERYGCLALGLEMPFKDNANRRDPHLGWSPERCRRLGRSTLEAVLSCIDALR